jgi:protein-disulfide isomerase
VAVANGAPEKYLDFVAKIWENQPEEGQEGPTDQEFAAFAAEVGVPDAVIKTFPDLAYADWVQKSNTAAGADGIRGTPGVKVNGEIVTGGSQNATVDVYTAGPLGQAIRDAANR